MHLPVRRRFSDRPGCRIQKGWLAMMSAMPVLIVIWAVLTGLFLALLAYNATISRYEENQVFLAEVNTSEQRQSTIVRRVNRVLPFLRAMGSLSAVMTVVVIGIYTWDAWQRIHQ
jgi:hypothetical protein